jgi:PST family polysaccharide transporter
VYKALGRPGLSIGISLVRLAVLAPVLLIAVQWGIVGIACAQLAAALLFALGMQMVAARVMDLRLRQLLRAVVPGVVCGVAVAAVGLAGLALPLADDLLTMFGIAAAAIGLVYVILRWGFSSLHNELLKLVRRPSQ